MSMRAQSLALGGAVLALGIGLSVGTGTAADEKKVRAIIVRASALLEKKDEDAAKKEAASVPKDAGMDDIMLVFKLRKSKGLGVGAKPIKEVSDGIESMIGNLEKRVPTKKVLEDYNDDIARAAYISAAIAEIIRDRCPVDKKKGDKDPADWKKWSDDMYKASLELAEAVKSKKATDIKAAAKKLNNSCLACHAPFKP